MITRHLEPGLLERRHGRHSSIFLELAVCVSEQQRQQRREQRRAVLGSSFQRHVRWRCILWHQPFTDRAPCAAQVTGYKIIGLSTVLATAARSMLDVQIVRSHLCELRDSSFIMPNHLPHIAHYAMSPTASSDSRFAFALQAQTDGAGVWPIQQWCGVQPPVLLMRFGSLVSVGVEGIAAPCCGHREPLYTHRSRFACSMRVPLRRGRGVWVFGYR